MGHDLFKRLIEHRARFLPAVLVLLITVIALMWFLGPGISVASPLSSPARTGLPQIPRAQGERPERSMEAALGPGHHGQKAQQEDGLTGPRDALQPPGDADDDKRPCYKGQDYRKSDLCAQWKAADAAFQAASYSYLQTVLSAAGVFGLVVSLFFSAYATWAASKGLRAATAALELGRQANAISLNEYRQAWKPTVVVTGIRLVPDWQSWFNRCNPIPMLVTAENIGGSSARVVDVVIDNLLIRDRDGGCLYRTDVTLVLPPIHRHSRRTAKLIFRQNRADLRATFDDRPGLGAHDIIVSGQVRSLNDDGQQIIEPFEWISDPYRRGGARLVENRPLGGRHVDTARAQGERDCGPHDAHEPFPLEL